MNDFDERRAESRNIIDTYYSVEFSIKGLDTFYQFKLWDMSPKGMCLVINEDSKVLKYIKVGDVLNMKYHPVESNEEIIELKTEVRHISKDSEGRFKKHSIVGLAILEQQNNDS